MGDISVPTERGCAVADHLHPVMTTVDHMHCVTKLTSSQTGLTVL